MNIRNFLFASALVAAVIGFGTYAFADDAPACKIASTDVLKTLPSAAQLSDVSQGEIDKLIEAKGVPPGSEGKPFVVKRIDMNDFSSLVIIQGDCINDRIAPVPSQMIDNVLGSVHG